MRKPNGLWHGDHRMSLEKIPAARLHIGRRLLVACLRGREGGVRACARCQGVYSDTATTAAVGIVASSCFCQCIRLKVSRQVGTYSKAHD